MFHHIRRFGRKFDDWLENHSLNNNLVGVPLLFLFLYEVLGLASLLVAWAFLPITTIANLSVGNIINFALLALGVVVAIFCVFAIYNTLTIRMARKRLENILKDTPEQLQRNKEGANRLVDLQATLAALGNDIAKAIVLMKASKSTTPDRRLGEVRVILSQTHRVMVTDAVLRDAQLYRAREAFEAETEAKVVSAQA